MEKGFQDILNRIMYIYEHNYLSIWFCQKHWPSLEPAYASISCTPTTTMEDLELQEQLTSMYIISYTWWVATSIKKFEQMQIHGRGTV